MHTLWAQGERTARAVVDYALGHVAQLATRRLGGGGVWGADVDVVALTAEDFTRTVRHATFRTRVTVTGGEGDKSLALS